MGFLQCFVNALDVSPSKWKSIPDIRKFKHITHEIALDGNELKDSATEIDQVCELRWMNRKLQCEREERELQFQHGKEDRKFQHKKGRIRIPSWKGRITIWNLWKSVTIRNRSGKGYHFQYVYSMTVCIKTKCCQYSRRDGGMDAERYHTLSVLNQRIQLNLIVR